MSIKYRSCHSFDRFPPHLPHIIPHPRPQSQGESGGRFNRARPSSPHKTLSFCRLGFFRLLLRHLAALKRTVKSVLHFWKSHHDFLLLPVRLKIALRETDNCNSRYAQLPPRQRGKFCGEGAKCPRRKCAYLARPLTLAGFGSRTGCRRW